MENFYQLATFALPPITGILTWFLTKRKRDSDTMQSLQNTIEQLAQSNEDLTKKVIEQSKVLVKLSAQVEVLNLENKKLKQIQEKLFKKIELI